MTTIDPAARHAAFDAAIESLPPWARDFARRYRRCLEVWSRTAADPRALEVFVAELRAGCAAERDAAYRACSASFGKELDLTTKGSGA